MSRRRRRRNRSQNHKQNQKSVTINKSVKKSRNIRLTVVQISEKLNGSSYVDWEIYNDKIHTDI